MEYSPDAGVFISLRELMVIFPMLKMGEHTMNPVERQILMKLEKTLYEYLSVEEAEELMHVPGSLGKGDGR
jgi:hypothetical protein